MTQTIEFCATIICGSALIIPAVGRTGAIAWLAAGLGTSLVLWAVVGSNVATWIASKHQ